MCVDDLECLEGLQLLQEGADDARAEGVEPELARSWVGVFGISGVCNVLAAIRAAEHYGLGPRQAVVTVATDGFDRYPSVLRRLDGEQGPMDAEEAQRRLEIFRSRRTDWMVEGTPEVRRRWHNQKYFTWVEQQGKTVEELRAQEDPAWWVAQQERAHEIDRRIRERRVLSFPGCVSGLVCVRCGRRYARGLDGPCAACGPEGVLEIEFDLARARRTLTRRALRSRPRNVWRYAELLPVPAGARRPALEPGWTPILDAPRLAAWAGVRQLLVKDEGRNPTASFKDRASAVGVARALSRRARVVACASTGNAATSLAGAAASVGLPCVIFVPEFAPEPKVAQLLIFGARVIRVRGSYDATWEMCQRACDRYGWYNRNAAVNPSLVEGKKTGGLEIAEQCGAEVPDWVAVSVGDGCTIAGIGKGLAEMKALGFIPRVPRLLGVQAAGARPLVDAFAAGRDLVPGPAETIADSICVGHPRNWRKALAARTRVGRRLRGGTRTRRSWRPSARRGGAPASSASRRRWRPWPVCVRPWPTGSSAAERPPSPCSPAAG